MVRHCCAIGCTKSSDLNPHLKYHGFPVKNLPLLQKWIKAIRRKNFTPTKSTKICANHFVQDDYLGRNLKRTAVPSIFNFKTVNQKSTKVLATEEDMVYPEEPQLAQSELYISPDLDTVSEPELSQSEQIIKKEWDPLIELGLDSSQVELQFESDVQLSLDEPPKLLYFSNSNASCREKETQKFFNVQSSLGEPPKLLYFSNSNASCREKETQQSFNIESSLDEPPKLLYLSNSNTSCNEMGTQTFLNNKCKSCQNNRNKFRVLRQKIRRKDTKINKLQNLITSLKEQIADTNKRKIKIVGNRIMLVDKLDNNKSLDNISINEQYQVALSVS